jgi:hypothetical protein
MQNLFESSRTALLVSMLLVLVTIGGCSNAQWANGYKTWGATHHVKQFSGGVLIGEWLTTGKVQNEAQSDGYYFEDDLVREVIRITGDVQIRIPSNETVEKIRARLKVEAAAKDAAEAAQLKK